MNRFDEMRAAVFEARTTLRAADDAADNMAYLLTGRLCKITSTRTLRLLKRELRKFNMTTGTWND